MTFRRTQGFHLQDLISGLRAKNRNILSKCITLIESTNEVDRHNAAILLSNLPRNENTIRIGITGVPGVGKSTFIEAFGKFLTAQNLSVAVLSIDPSSSLSRGSILGDKTRMERLSNDPKDFIRPTASRNNLGGVAATTRESILLCEAAAFDVILVETVGVGQSEIEIKQLVDYFLLLTVARTGDDLQGIKRGIMEMADHIVVNKADGDYKQLAAYTKKEIENAIHLFAANESGWVVPVDTCSSTEYHGIEKIWDSVLAFKKLTTENSWFSKNRRNQDSYWLTKLIHQTIEDKLLNSAKIKSLLGEIESNVHNDNQSIRSAVDSLLRELHLDD
jgi:LAO/AO transport system kinase